MLFNQFNNYCSSVKTFSKSKISATIFTSCTKFSMFTNEILQINVDK